MKFFLMALVGVLAACATRQPNSMGLDLMSESDYEKTVDAVTQRNQEYSGLYNTMDVTATLLTTNVAKAQLDQKARVFQWDKSKFQLEANKLADQLKNETSVFASFYTPEKVNDDLHKTGTQWRVYLETGGRRWEGKVMKIKMPVVEVARIYPYHTRFSTPYLITFPLPTYSIDRTTTRFIITGPVGISTLSFNPKDIPAEINLVPAQNSESTIPVGR